MKNRTEQNKRGEEVGYRMLSRVHIWRNRFLGKGSMREKTESRIQERKKKKAKERNECKGEKSVESKDKKEK